MARPKCIDFRIPPNDVLLEMIVVPAGYCRRFSGEADSVVAVDAPPITVPQPFLLGKYPVSVAQWAAVAGHDDETLAAESSWLSNEFRRMPEPQRNRTPAQCVTGQEASSFCERLAMVIGTQFTLPTEDEWEYACRDGSDDPFPVGDPKRYPQRYYGGSRQTQEFADAGPLPGTIPANQFGLLGMQAYLPEWSLVNSASGANPGYILCGSSANSFFGMPQPPWHRIHSERSGAKSGGFGFRLRCDLPTT